MPDTHRKSSMPALIQDFDFMFGTWSVQHRRLKTRLRACTEWDSFKGTCATAPVLGGCGNIEDNVLDCPDGAYRAIALRSLDMHSGQWAIWWLDHRAPHNLDVPVVGHFVGDTGIFLANDTFDGRPIKVRFLWKRGIVPLWEQAFSVDEGQTWETNWVMEFTRTGSV